VNFQPDIALVGRFDFLDPNTDAKFKGDARNYILGAFVWKPTKNVHLMPNVQVETYEAIPNGVAYDPSVTGRFTFAYFPMIDGKHQTRISSSTIEGMQMKHKSGFGHCGTRDRNHSPHLLVKLNGAGATFPTSSIKWFDVYKARRPACNSTISLSAAAGIKQVIEGLLASAPPISMTDRAVKVSEAGTDVLHIPTSWAQWLLLQRSGMGKGAEADAGCPGGSSSVRSRNGTIRRSPKVTRACLSPTKRSSLHIAPMEAGQPTSSPITSPKSVRHGSRKSDEGRL
jgi:hypothetical protein